MKLIHLSDLHLGKRVNEFSMVDDQEYILQQILRITEKEAPNAILIAGDVYDKSVPSAEAVEMFDRFLVQLSRQHQQVFIISGNHDSAERLAFGNRLMDASGIHLSPVYNGNISCFSLQDSYGTVHIHMLPFVKPAHVRAFFPEEEITSYTDAIRVALKGIDLTGSERNVLITHQFVTGAERSASEEVSVGGSDNVDASVFDGFDYVALGHIHGPQKIGEERIRYCGTPLKYSFSEARHKKTVTVAELGDKGVLSVRTVPLTPKHDLREIRGTFEEVTGKEFMASHGAADDYLHITLTDEDDIPEALSKLRKCYPNLMKLDYDNRRTRHKADLTRAADVNKSAFELFSEFFEQQNGSVMSEEQSSFVAKMIESIWEGKP